MPRQASSELIHAIAEYIFGSLDHAALLDAVCDDRLASSLTAAEHLSLLEAVPSSPLVSSGESALLAFLETVAPVVSDRLRAERLLVEFLHDPKDPLTIVRSLVGVSGSLPIAFAQQVLRLSGDFDRCAALAEQPLWEPAAFRDARLLVEEATPEIIAFAAAMLESLRALRKAA